MLQRLASTGSESPRFAVSNPDGTPAKLLFLFVIDAATHQYVWAAGITNTSSQRERHQPSAARLELLTPQAAERMTEEFTGMLALAAQTAGSVVAELTYGELPPNFYHNVQPQKLEAGREYICAVLGTVKESTHFVA